MRPKGHVPHIVSVEGIELAQGRVFPLVAPSETPVLKMDLMELTSLESGSKMVDAAMVDIHVAFIPSPANLVEVTKRQPLRPHRRLVGNKLGEEIVLPIVRHWIVHRCDLEITISIAIQEVHVSGETEFRGKDVCHLDDGIVPKQEKSP
jgi:hypothetical protein